MANITLGQNIASLRAQTALADASARMSVTLTRLSSGLRINSALDDAAGLAISLGLNRDSRVFSQALRNVSDGQSLISIADGALGELGNVAVRMRELATQAANGSFSRTQRLAMQTESDQLSKEFNRLIGTTAFNRMNLLDRSSSSVRIQGGYGTSGSVSFDITTALSRSTGTGGFTASALTAHVDNANLVDVNGDSILDLVANPGTASVAVRLGNGNGTFAAVAGFAVQEIPTAVLTEDFNGDGKIDVVAIGTSTLSVLLGNGNGTFQAKKDTTVVGGTIAAGDINGDGKIDIFASDGLSGSMAMGNGDGTFKVTAATIDTSPFSFGMKLADLNGDGRADLIGTGFDTQVFVALSQGSQFGSAYTAPAVALSSITNVADMNRDGIPDIIAANAYGTASVMLGNGDGTFKSGTSVALDAYLEMEAADMNGDGYLDLVSVDGVRLNVALANADGTFATQISTAASGSSGYFALGDMNGDGVTDAFVADTVAGKILLAGTSQTTYIQLFNLATQATAKESITALDSLLTRVANERGILGAAQSRLLSAFNSIAASRDNFVAAEGRIKDADVAQESAALARYQILQQSAMAVLAQANQAPALALQLLRE